MTNEQIYANKVQYWLQKFRVARNDLDGTQMPSRGFYHDTHTDMYSTTGIAEEYRLWAEEICLTVHPQLNTLFYVISYCITFKTLLYMQLQNSIKRKRKNTVVVILMFSMLLSLTYSLKQPSFWQYIIGYM